MLCTYSSPTLLLLPDEAQLVQATPPFFPQFTFHVLAPRPHGRDARAQRVARLRFVILRHVCRLVFRHISFKLHEELRERALAALGEGSSVGRDARAELQAAALA